MKHSVTGDSSNTVNVLKSNTLRYAGHANGHGRQVWIYNFDEKYIFVKINRKILN
jgi:hypothetical protein